MDERVKECLRAGETVHWEGKPENFTVLGGKNRTAILTRCVLVLIVAAAMLAGHVASNGEAKVGFVAVVLVIAAIAIVSPWWERVQLMRCRYWITDQRAIQMGKDGLFYSLELHEIDAFKLVEDGSAKHCLVLGSSVFEDAEKHIRWRANSPKGEKDNAGHSDHAIGMIFYNTSNAEAAVATLKAMGCAKTA